MRISIEVEKRTCEICGVEFEPRRYTQKCCSRICYSKAYNLTPKGMAVKKAANLRYKDRVRHNYKRKELLGESGYVCGKCGRKGSPFEIVAHHKTGDPNDHEHQELLCRRCHARLHHSGENSSAYKHISKEEIEYALQNFDMLEDMCKYLNISRAALYKKRKQFGLPSRTNMRGFNNPAVRRTTNNPGRSG